MKGLQRKLLILLLLSPQAAQPQLPPLQPQDIDWAAEAARLEMNRQLWNSHNIHRYGYLLDADCFCIQDYPVWIVVENGSIESITFAHIGESLRAVTIEGDEGPELISPFAWFLTVDKMFAEVERAIADHYGTTHPGPKAGGFSVEYDAQYGFPAAFTVNYRRGIAGDGREWMASDTELEFRVAGFKPQASISRP